MANTELEFRQAILDKVEVRAERDGLLLYSHESDWIGRPVMTGERVMELADPARTKLRIYLPVDDALVLQEGAEVEIFLDIDPLRRYRAEVERFSYHAEATPDDVLAYRVDARFSERYDDLRIGLKGTAKVYGDDVTLGFLVFRRPLAFLRQFVGI